MHNGQPDHRFHPIARSSHRPRIFNEMSLRKYSPHPTSVLSSTHTSQPRAKLSPLTQKTPSPPILATTASHRRVLPSSAPVTRSRDALKAARPTVKLYFYEALDSGVSGNVQSRLNEVPARLQQQKPTHSSDSRPLQVFHSLGAPYVYPDNLQTGQRALLVKNGVLAAELAALEILCESNGINHEGALMALIHAYPHKSPSDPNMHWTLVFVDRNGYAMEWKVKHSNSPSQARCPKTITVHLSSIAGLADPSARYELVPKEYYLRLKDWQRIHDQTPYKSNPPVGRSDALALAEFRVMYSSLATSPPSKHLSITDDFIECRP